MKKVSLFAIMMTLWLGSGPASAVDSGTSQSIRQGAPKGITEAFYACVDKAGGDVIAIGSCTSAEKKIQDSRLNQAYTHLMTKVDTKTKESMRSAERSWLDFNGKAVNAELELRGTDKTASIEASLSELFRYCERANDLENFVYFVND